MLPDEEFLTAIEHTVSKYAGESKTARESCNALMRYADGTLKAHAIPFSVTNDLRGFEWTGDQVIHDVAIAPALAALEDSRLENAREEFADALQKRRAGRVNDLRDAAHEAANAVESTLAVLLQVHQVDAPRQLAATGLLHRLVERQVLPGWTEHLVLASPQIATFTAVTVGASRRIRSVRTSQTQRSEPPQARS